LNKGEKMEYVTYEDLLNFWNAPNEKIKVVIFDLPNCETCDDFMRDVFEPIITTDYAEHFDVVKTDISDSSISFPPISNPTIYFNIPNSTDEPMPLIRVGGIPESYLRKDLDAMVKIKDEGLSIDEAFNNTPYAEVTSWIQRQLRF
jgi:hypothetical protein